MCLRVEPPTDTLIELLTEATESQYVGSRLCFCQPPSQHDGTRSRCMRSGEHGLLQLCFGTVAFPFLEEALKIPSLQPGVYEVARTFHPGNRAKAED